MGGSIISMSGCAGSASAQALASLIVCQLHRARKPRWLRKETAPGKPLNVFHELASTSATMSKTIRHRVRADSARQRGPDQGLIMSW
jgi:hypothetical protein